MSVRELPTKVKECGCEFVQDPCGDWLIQERCEFHLVVADAKHAEYLALIRAEREAKWGKEYEHAIKQWR